MISVRPMNCEPTTQRLMNRRQFIQTAAVISGGLLASTSRNLMAANWKEGMPLPDLGAFGLEGSIPNLKGKVVYLDFWASWCGPCKASFPVINRWHQEFGPKGFLVLGVNVDEEAAAMQAFLKKNTVGFPVVRDAGHKLVAAADVSTMPSSFIIDRKGVIRHAHKGFHSKDESQLAAQISALLGEA